MISRRITQRHLAIFRSRSPHSSNRSAGPVLEIGSELRGGAPRPDRDRPRRSRLQPPGWRPAPHRGLLALHTRALPASREEAADPPLGQLGRTLGVGLRVEDFLEAPRASRTDTIRRARRGGKPGSWCTVSLRTWACLARRFLNGMALADTLRVEVHTTAAAPHPVVRLHQTGQDRPTCQD